MATNNGIKTTVDNDGGDLLDTLEITKIRPREDADGKWVDGTIGGHRFVALVFAEHADDRGFELNDSRISKLWVQRNADRATVANFDRGWDVRPTNETVALMVDLLAAGLADHIFAH